MDDHPPTYEEAMELNVPPPTYEEAMEPPSHFVLTFLVKQLQQMKQPPLKFKATLK